MKPDNPSSLGRPPLARDAPSARKVVDAAFVGEPSRTFHIHPGPSGEDINAVPTYFAELAEGAEVEGVETVVVGFAAVALMIN